MDYVDWRLIKILVVDDDSTLRKSMAKFLDKIGCIGAYAENGKEALKLIRKYNFDLCFMDLFMPEMGGVEAAQIIQEEIDPRLPIIALTSSSMKADKAKCADVGMQDFLTKPISIEKIKNIICQYGIKNSE